MIAELRKRYNAEFTSEKYNNYIADLQNIFPGQLDFRVAETPLFIPKSFCGKILRACDAIIDLVQDPKYLEWSSKAVPTHLYVPGEKSFPEFIAFDFGICTNEAGELEPQLIEMQGFPSLLAWQVLLPEIHAKHFWTPEGFSPYLSEYSPEKYIGALKQILIGDEDPDSVVLLEIFPEKQKTRVDFHATKHITGVDTVCLTKIEQEGRKLFYNKDGKRVQIRRIYNRVIFDELYQQPQSVQEKGKIFHEELDVEWIPHPNWFYRLSKYTLPYIDHPYVPKTYFLNQLQSLPSDLGQYVVKPLFSFAGQGVIIDVTEESIRNIPDPENWIIQKKVNYASAIETPGENAKAEIRMFYFREPGSARPVAANNLARLSKGKMVGVRYNKDKDWVGGTFCLFEK
jgi:hypothetical protein